MGTVTLLLGIHNHQPQGNFDHVFRQGYDDCYRPLIGLIARHPRVKASVHHSGPLIEWIEANDTEYFSTVQALCNRGQVELLGGGFYEPMLSVLPEADARGQLRMMADFLEARTGRRPNGMWLAERVWEPDLARTINEAGYRYTLLDDGHFLAAGMRRPLRGHFLTEKAGRGLNLFPIAIELRYAIPFKPVDEAIALLLAVADSAGDHNVFVTYGDDGEKFGMWPGTKEWVWDKGWLESFLSALEDHSDRIRTATFSEALALSPPQGRIYLPTASYDEMSEWTLPVEAQKRLHDLHHAVTAKGKDDDWAPFVRGGIWQGFMAKYPEANFMHKRMCLTSERVAQAECAARSEAERVLVSEARRELYRGQCNCAYWHGLFGGLYLGKLRSAMHSHLIRADVLVDEALRTPNATARIVDMNADRLDEIVLTTNSLSTIVAPDQGGALLAIDSRTHAYCFTDVVARRREGYHGKVLALLDHDRADGTGDAPQSIHDMARLKADNLGEDLVYDAQDRLAFTDRFFPRVPAVEQLRRGTIDDRGDFACAAYRLDRVLDGGSTVGVDMSRSGRVMDSSGKAAGLLLKKSIRLESSRLTVDYVLEAESKLSSILFAPELSLILPCAAHQEGKLSFGPRATGSSSRFDCPGQQDEITSVHLRDPFSDVALRLECTTPATVLYFPLNTVSQSESGFERTYQGTVFTFVFPPWLESSQAFSPSIQLVVEN
jgi:alpha-amylase